MKNTYVIEIPSIGLSVNLPDNAGHIVLHSKEGSISASVDSIIGAIKKESNGGVAYTFDK